MTPHTVIPHGLDDKGKSENNTLYYWILAVPRHPAAGGMAGYDENDGGGWIARLL